MGQGSNDTWDMLLDEVHLTEDQKRDVAKYKRRLALEKKKYDE
jgi:hypothetical protein